MRSQTDCTRERTQLLPLGAAINRNRFRSDDGFGIIAADAVSAVRSTNCGYGRTREQVVVSTATPKYPICSNNRPTLTLVNAGWFPGPM